MKRTLVNDAPSRIGQSITVMGWVQTKRDHGKITFIDLRDRSGVLQIIGVGKLGDLHTEDVVKIIGKVKERQERLVNKDFPLGHIEMEAGEYELLSACAELPLPIDGDG